MPINVTASENWPAIRVVGWALALALLVAGLATLGAALIPIRVGNIDSEVGALGEAAATGPLLLIGVAATLFVAVRTRHRGAILASAALSLLLGFVLVGGLLLLGLDLPLVLTAAGAMDPGPAHAVEVVLAKSLALLGIEIVALLVLGFLGFRWWSAVRRTLTQKVVAR